jgi:hypothetical protein
VSNLLPRHGKNVTLEFSTLDDANVKLPHRRFVEVANLPQTTNSKDVIDPRNNYHISVNYQNGELSKSHWHPPKRFRNREMSIPLANSRDDHGSVR